MTEVTLDLAATSKLQSATDYLKLRDPDGRLVGFFLPLDPKQREFVFGVKSPLTEEEREARRQETGSRTLEEFWEEMRDGESI